MFKNSLKLFHLWQNISSVVHSTPDVSNVDIRRKTITKRSAKNFNETFANVRVSAAQLKEKNYERRRRRRRYSYSGKESRGKKRLRIQFVVFVDMVVVSCLLTFSRWLSRLTTVTGCNYFCERRNMNGRNFCGFCAIDTLSFRLRRKYHLQSWLKEEGNMAERRYVPD